MRTIEEQLSTYIPSIPHLSNEDVQGLQIYRIHKLDKTYVFHSYDELVKFKQRLTKNNMHYSLSLVCICPFDLIIYYIYSKVSIHVRK